MDVDKIHDYETLFALQETNTNSVETHKHGIVIRKECNVPTITHGLDVWECPQCGSIIEQMIDTSAEWRNYADGTKTDTVRCSAVINNLLPNSSKGTIILSSSNSNYHMRRTQKVHSWFGNDIQRTMFKQYLSRHIIKISKRLYFR